MPYTTEEFEAARKERAELEARERELLRELEATRAGIRELETAYPMLYIERIPT